LVHGNLGQLIVVIHINSVCVWIGLLLSLFSIKPLNALLLGENFHAQFRLEFQENTINYHFWQQAFCKQEVHGMYAGPIAFIVMVPHIAKLVFQTSNHSVLY
jgi:iron complex transport system permease protein